MKAALLAAAFVAFCLLVVMAVVFRSKTARDLLRLMRNLAWAWVAIVVVLALIECRRRGI